MKRLQYIMLAGLSAVSFGQLKAQSGTGMQTCEYWFDYGFGARVSEPMSGSSFSRAFDISALPAGVHSIGIRFGDSDGLWTAPVVKHFVVPALPPEVYDDNSIVGIDYWTDYDYAGRKRVAAADGRVALSLDVSAMSPGVHSFAYQVTDGRGLVTAPFVRHFVVPGELPAVATGIAAYEYWFNHGQRIRVNVDPQNPLDIKDMVIEIKDVIPNAITDDYRFDAAGLTVVQPDNVTFGIQAFDDLGTGSQAVVSESFPYDVTVKPAFVKLTKGQSYDFTAPAVGCMQGFELSTAKDESVKLCVTTGGRLDLYGEDGSRIDTERTDNGLGQTVYSAVADGTVTYALMWGAPVTIGLMQIEHVTAESAGMESIVTGKNGLTLHTGNGMLTVESCTDGRLTVVSAQGTVMLDERIAAGSYSYRLHPGVYVVRFCGSTISKIAIQ